MLSLRFSVQSPADSLRV